MMMHI